MRWMCTESATHPTLGTGQRGSTPESGAASLAGRMISTRFGACLYAGSSALACYLEGAGPISTRPRPAGEHWRRSSSTTRMSFCIPLRRPANCRSVGANHGDCVQRRCPGASRFPAHHETLPTLRQQFLQLAHRCGCTDLDAAAIRNTKRELTQPISAWIYKLRKPDTQPVSGIQYQSRHGDQLTLWAIYERDLTDSPPQITNHADKAVTPDDADLVEALRIPRIVRTDQ